ncbi:MAG TPA: tryptophan--tRNA ligase [Acidimicrobiales bacterium]|nr:tryptophan--tRNA ligase [Acidimicrobiales bacterium]
MDRVLSGIQPTGVLHLGNYLGAVRFWVEDQYRADAFFCVVDLHALTVEHDPATLRAATLRKATELLACGLDPEVCTLFVQSHVAAHSQLCWLMECTASYGELRRMTQFKDKSDGQEGARAALLTYPCLMAADILLYDTTRVPVGDDQRQHLELTRDLAIRWNHRYGDTFVVPEAAIPRVGARVMDLQEPTAKMSKSRGNPQGRIEVFEDPAAIARKVRRAVTDTGAEVHYDPAAKPGVSNLLELLAVTTDRTPQEVAEKYTQYGPLKADTAEAVVEFLRPLQARFHEFERDPAAVREALAQGAVKAAHVADAVLARAQGAIGLLPA